MLHLSGANELILFDNNYNCQQLPLMAMIKEQVCLCSLMSPYRPAGVQLLTVSHHHSQYSVNSLTPGSNFKSVISEHIMHMLPIKFMSISYWYICVLRWNFFEGWLNVMFSCNKQDITIGNGMVQTKTELLFSLSESTSMLYSCHYQSSCYFMSSCRARYFPLPDSPGQVKLPVGQVDLNRFSLFISYKQIEEFQNSWSQASDDFEKRQALSWIYLPVVASRHQQHYNSETKWLWSGPGR